MGAVTMKVNVVAVGNLKDKFFKDACEEYAKRIGKYASFTCKELTEEDVSRPERVTLALEKEGEAILKAIKGKCYLMAVKGDLVSSEELADIIKKDIDQGQEITFVIGSSYGVCKRVEEAAAKRLSFGRITLPHRLMRVVLLEQIYRAFTIIKGAEYHK